MKIELDPIKDNPVKRNHPAATDEVFSVRWLGAETEDFLAGDIFDAYKDEHGTVYGASLGGSWLPIGEENVHWEWMNYGNKTKRNGRHTVQTPRRWYWVNHENGVVVGPMPRARAVRMMEDANLNYSADTTAVSEPTMLRDYNGGHYKVPVKYSKSKDDTTKRNPYYGRTPKWRREEQSDMPPQFLTYEQDIKRLQGLADDAWNDGNIQGSNRYSQLLWDKHGIVYPYDFKPVKEVKPNGFKHARPFGGSVGREQYHVHFEDAKGVIYYYAGNTDRGVKLEREYTKAKKFTKQKAAALAKKLDRLYKNVRHDGGHFYAESAGDVKANPRDPAATNEAQIAWLKKRINKGLAMDRDIHGKLSALIAKLEKEDDVKANGVDTPYAGSYADVMSRRALVRGLHDPRNLPIMHQQQQRLMNIQKRLGTGGYSREDAARALREEMSEFPLPGDVKANGEWDGAEGVVRKTMV